MTPRTTPTIVTYAAVVVSTTTAIFGLANDISLAVMILAALVAVFGNWRFAAIAAHHRHLRRKHTVERVAPQRRKQTVDDRYIRQARGQLMVRQHMLYVLVCLAMLIGGFLAVFASGTQRIAMIILGVGLVAAAAAAGLAFDWAGAIGLYFRLRRTVTRVERDDDMDDPPDAESE